MQIIIFQRRTDRQFLKTLQILGVGRDNKNPVNIGIFDNKLNVFHGFN